MDFETEYQALLDRLVPIFEDLNKNKKKSTRNNTKLKGYDEELDKLSREIDRLREKYKEQYKIWEMIEGVQSTHRYIVEDMRKIRNKPTSLELVPNWNPRPRSQSFPGAFKNLFTRKKGGKKNKTRKH
jgi:hypothetical protein